MIYNESRFPSAAHRQPASNRINIRMPLNCSPHVGDWTAPLFNEGRKLLPEVFCWKLIETSTLYCGLKLLALPIKSMKMIVILNYFVILIMKKILWIHFLTWRPVRDMLMARSKHPTGNSPAAKFSRDNHNWLRWGRTS